MHTIPIHLTESSVFSGKWFHLIEENMNTVLTELIFRYDCIERDRKRVYGKWYRADH